MNIRALLLAAATACACACTSPDDESSPSQTSDESLVLRLHSDTIGNQGKAVEALAARYKERTGIEVQIVGGPSNSSERLMQYQMYFGARAPVPDVCQIDVIWPGILKEHLVDVSDTLGPVAPTFFPPVVQSNTIDGRVVALPWFGDAGLLYVRTDLLEKHGFAHPPETWDELESMARAIQDAERAGGAATFWGYVWQGRANEALTCNALEWIASEGGGRILEPDGAVSVSNADAERAVARAAAWIGAITPPDVLDWSAEEARREFQRGNAAFMRNWSYAAAPLDAPGSPVAGRFAVARLPAGKAGRAAALGGWQLGVSEYSLHRKEAIDLAAWLASPEAQTILADISGLLPANRLVYDDVKLLEKRPSLPVMREAFESGVARPSALCGEDYGAVSAAFYRGIHEILEGKKPADEGLLEVKVKIETILAR